VLLFVWIAIAVYLALYYWTPLAVNLPDSQGVLRRGQVLASLFFPDEILPYWFEGASWHALAERAGILAASAAMLLVAAAAGWICLHSLSLDRHLTRLETFVFSCGVGLNVTSLATLALGLCGVMSPWVLGLIGLAVVAAAGGLWWNDDLVVIHRPAKPGASIPPPASALQPPAWLGWLCVPFALAIIFGAMLPPADFDVREYHLQAPKEFYQAGRIGFLPHNIYANMPLGTEMLSLAGMIICRDWWTGALVGKTTIALFAPLAALMLIAAGRRLASPTAGIVAALVYISIPWIALVSVQGLVEGAFAFYLLAALYAVILWRESGPAGQRLDPFAGLAGFLAGSAVACKYPAVVYCVLPLAACLAWLSLRANRGAESPARSLSSAVKPMGAFLLFVALGCGPWFVKNLVTTGNPVYPLLYDVFGGRTRTVEKNEQWTAAHDPPNFRPADLVDRAARVTLTSDWLSPLVMPLAALGLLAGRRPLAWWLAGYFAYVFLAWWLFTHRIDRFWIPILPLGALLAGFGATWNASRWWRVPFLGLLLFGLASNFVVITSGVLGDNRYLADLDRLRLDPRRVDGWHLYLNGRAGQVTGVLLVGDAQPFDLEVPASYNTVFDDNIFEKLVRGRSPAEVHKALADRKLSHIYVAWHEIARYRSPGNYGITDFLQPQVFDGLVAAGVLEEIRPVDGEPGQLFRVMPPAAP
jgi:hypothetical protein